MSKILMTYGNNMKLPEGLKDYQLIQPEQGQFFKKDYLLTVLPECEAIIAANPIDREMIEVCKDLKIIVSYGAGYEHIDVQAATEHDVPVVNIPDSVTESTAQLALALMLAVPRHLGLLDRKMRSSEPSRNLFHIYGMQNNDLEGLTLGVVGLGRIGARVAELAQAFRMKVVYYSRTEKAEAAQRGMQFMALDDLLKESDVVSMHCPLTEASKGMIGKHEISLMKPTAYFVNTARGKLVDEEELIKALQENRIAGAGLDVFATEPDVTDQMKALDNVMILPHVGGNTKRTRMKMEMFSFAQIEIALKGQKPDNLLNPQVWEKLHAES